MGTTTTIRQVRVFTSVCRSLGFGSLIMNVFPAPNCIVTCTEPRPDNVREVFSFMGRQTSRHN